MIFIDNIETIKDERKVVVSINPNIYPISVIMNAAYKFVDDFWVSVGGTIEKIEVTIETKKETNLKEIGKRFNEEIIHSYLKQEKARQYSKTRNSMMLAALTPISRKRNKAGGNRC